MTQTPLILLLSAVALLSALPADAQCTNCGVIPGSPAEVALVGATTSQRIGETADVSFDGNWAAIGMPGSQISNAGQVQLYMRDSYFTTTSWARNNTLSLSDFGISPVGNDSFGWTARIGGNDFLAVTSPGPVDSFRLRKEDSVGIEKTKNRRPASEGSPTKQSRPLVT